MECQQEKKGSNSCRIVVLSASHQLPTLLGVVSCCLSCLLRIKFCFVLCSDVGKINELSSLSSVSTQAFCGIFFIQMQNHKWMVVIGIRDPQMQPSNNVHTLINVSALPKYYNSKASCCYVLYCLLLSNFLKAVCVARKFNGSFPPKT